MKIQKAALADVTAIAALAGELWPESSIDAMFQDFSDTLQDAHCAVYLAYNADAPIGFAQCGLRYDYVEGTQTSPVGYLEGIFVAEAYRKQGIARALMTACENWAKDMGCTEFASDCELANVQSLAFHLNSGFTEANRIICFTKKL